LVTMAHVLDLPADAPFSLFAVGRMAGWLAHAIEQLHTGRLIRPRARYVGQKPQAATA
jgi:citrate synthase